MGKNEEGDFYKAGKLILRGNIFYSKKSDVCKDGLKKSISLTALPGNEILLSIAGIEANAATQCGSSKKPDTNADKANDADAPQKKYFIRQ